MYRIEGMAVTSSRDSALPVGEKHVKEFRSVVKNCSRRKVRCIEWNGDGTQLLYCFDDGRVRVFDAERLEQVQSYPADLATASSSCTTRPTTFYLLVTTTSTRKAKGSQRKPTPNYPSNMMMNTKNSAEARFGFYGGVFRPCPWEHRDCFRQGKVYPVRPAAQVELWNHQHCSARARPTKDESAHVGLHLRAGQPKGE